MACGGVVGEFDFDAVEVVQARSKFGRGGVAAVGLSIGPGESVGVG